MKAGVIMQRNGTLSLLIADDEASIRQGLSSTIDWEARHVHIVGEARNGDEAFEKICALRPDIVITDIKMPASSGLDLIERVRAAGGETHFIILSGYDDFAFAQRAIRSKIACYLLKPVKTDVLLAEVERIREEESAEMRSGARYDRAQLAAQRGSDVLEEQFYKKLADGEFHSENDILGTLHSLHLDPIPCPCIAAVLRFVLPCETDVSLFTQKDAHLFKVAFRNVLDEMARGNRNVEVFEDHGYEIGILVAPKENLIGFLTEFTDTMKQIGQAEFTVGIGSPAETLLDVTTSCRTAFEAVEYHMYETGSSFFDFDELAASQPEAKPPQPPAMQKLAEAVVSDDTAAIERELDSFFEKIFYIPVPPPRYVRGMCSYLLGDVSNRVIGYLRQGCSVPLAGGTDGIDGLATFREIRAFLLQALTDMAAGIQSDKKAHIPPSIEEAQNYIRSHVFSRLLVKSVAEQMHLSESYFTALFKKTVGITVQDYILNCKLEKAKELLIEKKMSIFEISDLLEYRDYRSFSRAFKRYTGNSPTEFQQKITNLHGRQ